MKIDKKYAKNKILRLFETNTNILPNSTILDIAFVLQYLIVNCRIFEIPTKDIKSIIPDLTLNLIISTPYSNNLDEWYIWAQKTSEMLSNNNLYFIIKQRMLDEIGDLKYLLYEIIVNLN